MKNGLKYVSLDRIVFFGILSMSTVINVLVHGKFMAISMEWDNLHKIVFGSHFETDASYIYNKTNVVIPLSVWHVLI